MAGEIVQELGFDVTAALTALETLNTGFTTFEQHLQSVGSALTTWNAQASPTIQILRDIASNALAAATAMGKLSGVNAPVTGAPGGPATPLPPITPKIDSTPIKETEAQAAKLVVTWGTLSRVVQTQIIVRALSMLRDAMREAFDSNLTFMTSVAEIQSVAPGVSNSLDSIAQHVADLSRQFNIPLAQVAEAQYQVLSNQFTSTAQQSDVLTAAFKLSKVAVMDAGQAVNLVAGTLNAYHMSSTQAEAVAAKFFGTIQIGRVRGEDLASVLGKVTAVSSELGVSLEELNSLMVTLTISGVKPAEAATSLRSSMMALLKPSQDLSKELRQLGFDSGPQMIAAYGLEGALVKLRGTTDENMSALAKLIPNVRALSGVLRETDDEGRRTAEALQHLREMTVAAFNEKYKIFIESDAQKTIAELNKLKVFLTTDLGAAIVKAVNQMMGFAGGADALGAGIKAMIPVVLVGGAAFVIYAGAMGATALSARLAASSLAPLGLAISGATLALVAFAAFDFADTRIIQGIKQVEEEFQRVETEKLEIVRAANQKRAEEEDRANQEIIQRSNQALAIQRKDYFDMVDDARDDNKRLVEDTHATMDKIVSGSEHQVHVLRDLAREADRTITDANKHSKEIAGTLADTRFSFDETQWKSAAQRQEDFGRRARQLAAEAEAAMGKAKTPQDVSEAQSIYKRAAAFGQEAAQLAARRKDTLGQEDAERQIEAVLQSEIRANETLKQHKATQAQAAERAAAQEEQRVTRMRELAKDVMKEMDLFDKKGQPLVGKDRETAVAKTKADLQEFQGLLFAGKKFDPSVWLNFDTLKRRMQDTMTGAVTKAEVRDLFVADQSLKKLNERITTGIGRINLDVFVGGDKSKLAGKTMEEQFKIAGEYAPQQAAIAKQTKEAYDDQVDALAQIEVRQKRITGDLALQRTDTVGTWQAVKIGMNLLTGPLFGTTGMTGLKTAAADFADINKTIAQLTKNPLKIDDKQLNALVDRVSSLKTSAPWSLNLNLSSTEMDLKALKEIWDYEQKIKSNQSKFPTLNQTKQKATEEMKGLDTSFPKVEKKVEDVTDKFSSVQKAIDGLSMASFVAKVEAAAQAVNLLASAAGTGGAMTAAHGGMAFLAGGGRPRGTDTIPAMLSPGEMVMSAATTRRFASTLVAMNAGAKPSYHGTGGTTVGDINVGGITVNESKSGRGTARQIATELRRELRRNTSVL